MHVQLLSCTWLFMTSWTVACQAPLSTGFFSKNTGVGCHFLLQGIFPIQRSNPCLLHWQADSLPLKHQGSSKHCLLLVKLPPGSTEICRSVLLFIYMLPSPKMNFQWCRKWSYEQKRAIRIVLKIDLYEIIMKCKGLFRVPRNSSANAITCSIYIWAPQKPR